MFLKFLFVAVQFTAFRVFSSIHQKKSAPWI